MTATDAAADAFAGFPDEALSFYDGLAADNSKTYWSDRREVYERCVRRPMLALLAQLQPEFGPANVFRPHRDVRFSADKSPYKTHLGALVREEGAARCTSRCPRPACRPPAVPTPSAGTSCPGTGRWWGPTARRVRRSRSSWPT